MVKERIGLQDAREVLETARTVAVVGVSVSPEKPAHYVPEYLYQYGYRIIGVNPKLEGQTMFGESVRGTLASIQEPVDVVEMFRRAEHLKGHLDDILAMNPRPKLVWVQLGIRNDEFARKLLEAGIEVVQDRCMLADHRHLSLGRPQSTVNNQ
jgi:predicted CoA-binding protein